MHVENNTKIPTLILALMDTITFKNIDARIFIAETSSKCINNKRLKEANEFIAIGDHLFNMQSEYYKLIDDLEIIKKERIEYKLSYLKSLLEIKRLNEIIDEYNLANQQL